MEKRAYLPRKQIYFFYIFILKQHMNNILGHHYPLDIINLIIHIAYIPIKIYSGWYQSYIITDHIYVKGYDQSISGDYLVPIKLDQESHQIVIFNLEKKQQMTINDELFFREIPVMNFDNSFDSETFNSHTKLLNIYSVSFLEEYLEGSSVKEKCCGRTFTVLLTNTGDVYTWGHNGCMQLGQNTSQHNQKTVPRRLSDLKYAIVSICCGIVHTLALTEPRSKIYVWGANYHGQLGLGDLVEISLPEEIIFSEKIMQICCGAFYSVAVSDSGHTYAWGCNDRGQLGLGNYPLSTYMPQRLEIDKIISVSCGDSHTMFLTLDGELYGCGNYDMRYCCSPQKIFSSNIISVKCGMFHTIVLTSDDEIYFLSSNKLEPRIFVKTNKILFVPDEIKF